MTLSMSTQIARNPELFFATAGDEVMMMDIKSGNYFGLDPVGRRIWECLAEPVRVADICAQLTSEYDIDPGTCQAEVLTFLTQLAEHRIIDVVSG